MTRLALGMTVLFVLVGWLVPLPVVSGNGIAFNSASTTILITAVYYDTYLTGEPDEAFRLMNISGSPVNLTNWTVTDGEGTITLIGTLSDGASIWITREADDFTLEFGFAPDYEYGGETDPLVPNLSMSGDFTLANTGDEIILKENTGAEVDCAVYEDGDPTACDWSGSPIEPYGGATVGVERFAPLGPGEPEGFGVEGQILYRKLDQATGLPVPDTDTASNWAQATDDNINGKKVQYPG
jgi:Lamin Tail Domain